MSFEDASRSMGLAKPGRGLIGVMIALGTIWLAFAIAVNWAGASEDLFLLFCGSTERILAGQIWRLFTAPLMHAPSGTVGHILWAILGLFFLAPALESHWGTGRFLRFLLLSGVFAYAVQMLGELVLPASVAHRLVGEYWFGSVPVLEATAVAWALSFRGQTVRLWFVLPVTSTGLVVFICAMSFLRIVAATPGPEGLLSPFGGILAGWLFGGGTPSPIRRAYLKLRLAQLDREARSPSRNRPRRAKESPLRVIEGGRGRSSSDRDGGPGGGRMLH